MVGRVAVSVFSRNLDNVVLALEAARREKKSSVTLMFTFNDSIFFSMCVVKNQAVIDIYNEKLKRRPSRLKLDPESLRWTPVVSRQMLVDEENRAEFEVLITLHNAYMLQFNIHASNAAAFLLHRNNSFTHLDS